MFEKFTGSKLPPSFESGKLDEKVVRSVLEHTTQHGAIVVFYTALVAMLAYQQRKSIP
jgi:hypothetical protein